ncbi:MAG: FecR domain-containing protein [Pseudomonadota bacterium]
MLDPEKSTIAEEAADIFLRLKSDPNNAQLIAERDAFIERGPTEKKAYAAVSAAWSGVTPKSPSHKMPVIALAAILGLLAYVAADPVKIYVLADHQSDRKPQSILSLAGDRIAMDASTSLQNLSDSMMREYTLLEGAALFEVASETRPFAVNLGPVDVRVTGTVFETAHQGDILVVSVIEGSVKIRLDDQTWDLSEGMSFKLSDTDGARVGAVAPGDIASWRNDSLVANGMRFGEVVAVLDRRMPGTVYTVGRSLADQPVSGIIDLADPKLALQTLAISRGARVTDLGPVGAIIYP